jgi:hypothetical protein
VIFWIYQLVFHQYNTQESPEMDGINMYKASKHRQWLGSKIAWVHHIGWKMGLEDGD